MMKRIGRANGALVADVPGIAVAPEARLADGSAGDLALRERDGRRRGDRERFSAVDDHQARILVRGSRIP